MKTKATPKLYRQGDVLLMQINAIPPEAEVYKNNGRIVLAYGEVTGHAHAISTDYATMYKWQGDTLIEVKPGATLTHEEHTAIALPPGAYRQIQQMQYTPEAIRPALD